MTLGFGAGGSLPASNFNSNASSTLLAIPPSFCGVSCHLTALFFSKLLPAETAQLGLIGFLAATFSARPRSLRISHHYPYFLS